MSSLIKEGTCAYCGGPKPLGVGRKICDPCRDTSNASRKKDRHSPEAKARAKMRERIRRQKPEVKSAMAESSRRWRQRAPLTYLVAHARKRAAAKGLEFSITIHDLSLPTTCPWLGIPIVAGGVKDNSPSLDRIDSTKGYVPGNVEVISWRANQIKSDATMAELVLMGKYAALKAKQS